MRGFDQRHLSLGWLCVFLMLGACGGPAAQATMPPTTPAQPAAAVAPTMTPPPLRPTPVPATVTLAPSTATAASTSAPTVASTPAATLVAPVTPAAGEARVGMKAIMFEPATLSVTVGTTVVWTNQEAVPHTVAHEDLKTFSSDILNQGDTFRFTFTQPGTHPYLCTVHPEMKGVITVR